MILLFTYYTIDPSFLNYYGYVFIIICYMIEHRWFVCCQTDICAAVEVCSGLLIRPSFLQHLLDVRLSLSCLCLLETHGDDQSRTGCKFLTGQGVQEGAAHCVERTFSYRYCRLKPSSSGVLLKIEVGIR